MKLIITQENKVIQTLKFDELNNLLNMFITIYTKTFYKCVNFNFACFKTTFQRCNAVLDSFIHLNKLFLSKNDENFLPKRTIHSLKFDLEDINYLKSIFKQEIKITENKFYNLEIKDAVFFGKIKNNSLNSFLKWENNYLKSFFLHQIDIKKEYLKFNDQEKKIFGNKIKKLLTIQQNEFLTKFFSFVFNKYDALES